MRDDVKDLFNNLLKHLDSKKILLNNLLENEKSASDLLKYRNDAEDDLLRIIEDETASIDEINIIDYDISQIKDEINRRYSIDFDKIFKKNYYTSEPEIINYKDEVLLHEDILNRIIILKKQNNILMENDQEDLKIQIDELERMSKLKIINSKDLQSF